LMKVLNGSAMERPHGRRRRKVGTLLLPPV
jgi:hypothetical protein